MTARPDLQRRVDDASARLRDAVAAHAPAVFTTSLGLEDMVVLDLIVRGGLSVDVVTFETGRLHEETLELLDRARRHYGRPIRALYPDRDALEGFVAEHGVNGFYASIDVRKRCCEIRKTQPLARALAGHGLWITGLRREQSATRAGLDVLASDDAHRLMKLNPLVDWSLDDVQAYLRWHDVPTNVLHARGFPSIGCAPCTRAVAEGDDPRSGRWWWEDARTRECGLHVAPDGRLVRARPADAIPVSLVRA